MVANTRNELHMASWPHVDYQQVLGILIAGSNQRMVPDRVRRPVPVVPRQPCLQ